MVFEMFEHMKAKSTHKKKSTNKIDQLFIIDRGLDRILDL